MEQGGGQREEAQIKGVSRQREEEEESITIIGLVQVDCGRHC